MAILTSKIDQLIMEIGIMHSEIYRIAYQLNTEGKNPSVALIRSRLSTPTSLPVIVQALQQWKLNPALGREAKKEGAEPLQASTETTSGNEEVQQQLTRLESKIDHIIALLEAQQDQQYQQTPQDKQ
ncbi:MAG: hypothetical protein MJK04_29610 [Psychrosphaera sp.]|nr:hypothetical protein [Psychrosphaera sp.]